MPALYWSGLLHTPALCLPVAALCSNSCSTTTITRSLKMAALVYVLVLLFAVCFYLASPPLMSHGLSEFHRVMGVCEVGQKLWLHPNTSHSTPAVSRLSLRGERTYFGAVSDCLRQQDSTTVSIRCCSSSFKRKGQTARERKSTPLQSPHICMQFSKLWSGYDCTLSDSNNSKKNSSSPHSLHYNE